MDKYSNIFVNRMFTRGGAVKLTVVYIINNKIPRYKSLNY